MKNLFLSPKTSDFTKIFQYMDTFLNEQRNQRMDLAQIKRTLDYMIKVTNHQDTRDYYRKEDEQPSHQTDLDDHE